MDPDTADAQQMDKSHPKEPPPNLDQWNANAGYWDATLQEGNNMFRELILPTIEDLTELQPNYKVLDLGTGNGVVARRLVDSLDDGDNCRIQVIGTDYSPAQLENARRRTADWWKTRGGGCVQGECMISFEELDLLDGDALNEFAMRQEEKFDIITISMVLKELRALEPLASFLPRVLKKEGKVITANLHPCFHKPGAHRMVEVLENPRTGEQEIHHSIKVSRYLDIPDPVQSQALRGQPESLLWFHRPIHELLEPFFAHGLVMDAMREPGFTPRGTTGGSTGTNTSQQIQSYENFGQIPMLFIFRLVFGQWRVVRGSN